MSDCTRYTRHGLHLVLPEIISHAFPTSFLDAEIWYQFFITIIVSDNNNITIKGLAEDFITRLNNLFSPALTRQTWIV